MKSQRRIVHDAHATVGEGGGYYNPKIKFEIAPIGHAEKAVSFELEFFQWKQIRHDVTAIGKRISDRLRQAADSIAQQAGEGQ